MLSKDSVMPKISYVMITARENYPYLSRPDMHVFDPTLRCMRRQTMKNFEWVIVDALYDTRHDYFEGVTLPFTVKHVPSYPNVWHERGLPGIASQYNRGIIHSDGELLFFTGDSYMMREDFMVNMWKHYSEGFFPLAWYMRDYGESETVYGPDGDTEAESSVRSPVSYDLCGFTGSNVALEHRCKYAFQYNSEFYQCNWEWWFGCSSADLKAMLRINGFDQRFDADYTLMDCDVGSRLEMSGYNCFGLFKDLFLVRIPSDVHVWSGKVKKDKKFAVKCNYGLLWLNREFNVTKANVKGLTVGDVSWIKYTYCHIECPINKKCREEYNYQFPFENRKAHGNFTFWRDNVELIDLVEERELRFDENKYAEGTFKWAR